MVDKTAYLQTRYYFVLRIGTDSVIQHSLHSRGRKVLCERRVHSVVVALKEFP